MDNPENILAQVRDCLSHWDIKPDTITLASHSENLVYHVVCEDRRAFALRIHRPGYHSLAELNSEHIWTSHLLDINIPIPRAIETPDGSFYLPVKVNDGTRYVGLIEWLEGEPLYQRSQNRKSTHYLCEQLTRLGELMARMHNDSEKWQPGPGFERHSLDIDGFFGETPFWGQYWEVPILTSEQKALLVEDRARIITELEALGQTPDLFGMIHADLHHGNVFLTQDNFYIIDFDDAGFGWYLYDIAVILETYQDWKTFDQIKHALLIGYERQRHLPEAQKALIPLFQHIRALATIGWAHARPELGRVDALKTLIKRSCDTARTR